MTELEYLIDEQIAKYIYDAGMTEEEATKKANEDYNQEKENV